MARTIAIANQKGGVGKTTTTANLGVAFSIQNKRVLIVDFDPQADLTNALGFRDGLHFKNSINDLMKKEILNEEYNPMDFVLNHNEGVDVIPSTIELASMELTLVAILNREKILKSILCKFKNIYDYILIDCNPSLGMLTINALASADSLIIPVQSEFLAEKGLQLLFNSITNVRKGINKNLKIEGILITMVDERTNLSRKIKEDIKQKLGNSENVYNTFIPRCVALAECTGIGESILKYDSKSKGAEAYSNLCKEVLENETRSKKRNSSKIR